jgi:ribosomal protein S8
MSMAIVAAVGAATPMIVGGINAATANRKAKLAEAKQRQLEQQLKNFEQNRQAVINQADNIRALKSQVFNPYANLAVATKAADQQIQQTDQALANTLDSINRAGTGAGSATALAQMAAKSKAQISASLEKQEVANQKLRLEGEAGVQEAKMNLEQAALNEEVAAYGRQEERDLTTLDRLASLGQNQQAQAMAYGQDATQSLMGGIESGINLGTQLAKQIE